MRKKIQFSILFTTVFLSTLSAQDYLVDYTFLGNRSKLELLPILFVIVDYDISLYKIRYKTLDINMQPDTASGLLAVPQVPANTKLPLVLYAHGTTTGPEDVPSNLKGGYAVAMGYAGFGFATVAPDYLGLGDARGFHPYLHADSEASASLDMIFAGHEFLEYNDPDLDPEFLFLAGYSQGGHSTMALHKELEEFWSFSFPVTAAAHMSGPYSISGAMRDRVLSNDPYDFPSYIAYIFLGYNEAYDLYNETGQVFKQPYATDIQRFYNDIITLDELNVILLDQLAANGESLVKDMLHDSIVDAITNDLNHPLNLALQDNDTYNWAPVAPTRLYYCGMDTQVPPINSIIADSVMNALGAADVQAINLNNSYDHGPCVFPAILNSKNFFRSFVTASSSREMTPANDFTIYPNPVLNELRIDWEPSANGIFYHIVNAQGEIIDEGFSATSTIKLKDYPSGLYVLTFSSGSETRTARMFRK